MDFVDQTVSSLLDGVDHGAATAVTLGSTMAARTLWKRIRQRAKRVNRPLGEDERALLAAEPGQMVNIEVLRQLLRMIPRGDQVPDLPEDHFTIGGDFILRDKTHIGGDVNVYNFAGPARGARARSSPGADSVSPAAAADRSTGWDIGVITVLSEETSAVTAMLNATGVARRRVGADGLRFCEAETETASGTVNVVATQALDRGQRSAAISFGLLQQQYAPRTVVLAGIAGGISPDVSLGDVVIVHEVVYYDLRKEGPGRTVRRGQARPVPAATRRAVNAFFSDCGEPCRLAVRGRDGNTRDCHVLPGPVGSGEAVIASSSSEIRRYLTAFNDKTLAVETEAGGVAEAFYETAGMNAPGTGWLAVRGISDHADARKDDTYHEIASWHAAEVLRQLLPYLVPDGGTGA